MLRSLALALLCSQIAVLVYGKVLPIPPPTTRPTSRSTEISSEEVEMDLVNTSGGDEPAGVGLECRIGKKVFVVNATEKVSWYGGYLYCRKNNMDLAVISNAGEHGLLVNAIKQRGVADDVGVWTSGYYDTELKKYQWMTRVTPMNYTVWRQGHPGPGDQTHKCVELRGAHQHKMDGVFCMDENLVACQTQEHSWGTC